LRGASTGLSIRGRGSADSLVCEAHGESTKSWNSVRGSTVPLLPDALLHSPEEITIPAVQGVGNGRPGFAPALPTKLV
jgi:hypothetical protein